MNRLPIAGAALPRRTSPAALVSAALFSGLSVAMLALIMQAVSLAILASVVAVLIASGIVVLHRRSTQRQDRVDLYLLRVSGLLGWAAPSRSHVTASRWRGWIGHPTRLRVEYNPLADESVPEIIIEARRLAQRAFGIPFKVAKHKKSVVTLTAAPDSPADQARDAQIERVSLAVTKTFGASTKSTAKFVNQKLTEITVHYEVNPRFASPALRARIESSISYGLEGRWRAFWDPQHDTVRLEVRPQLAGLIPNPNNAPADVDPRASYATLRVPFAVDEDGNTISWKPKDDPHGLITGKTGAGKTVCLLGIIQYLAAHGWEIWGIDGKRIELLGLRSWPNVRVIAGRIDHQARVMHEVFQVMQKRLEDYEHGLMRLEDFTPVLFVIDEFKTFRNAVTRWYRAVKPKGPGVQAPVLEEFSDFVSLARKVRMHAVVGLQRPDAEFLTGDMRDNFGFRASFGRLSPDGAQMMWQSYSTGVAVPVNAKGRGVAHNNRGEPVEIQAYWTPDPYQTVPDQPENWVQPGDLQLVNQIRPHHQLHELMAIVDPESQPDLDGVGGGDHPTYLDYIAAPIVPARRADELQRKAAGIFARVDADAAKSPTVQVMNRIQQEESEPELTDEEELFAGYDDPVDTIAEGLLDDNGDLAADGVLVLLDPDNDTWGLIDFAEADLADDGYIEISYRDYKTGEPASLTIPTDLILAVRRPRKA